MERSSGSISARVDWLIFGFAVVYTFCGKNYNRTRLLRATALAWMIQLCKKLSAVRTTLGVVQIFHPLHAISNPIVFRWHFLPLLFPP